MSQAHSPPGGDALPRQVVILCTAPDEETAGQLSRALVEARLAACVARHGAIRSVYRWEGAVEEAEEVQLVIKTSRQRAEEAMAFLANAHPYDVPEILCLQTRSSEAYGRWVDQETTPEQ